MNLNKTKLSIIGLGYVGLPLAIEFGKNMKEVVGFDVNVKRINELKFFSDSTGEILSSDIKLAKKLKFSYDLNEIMDCNCYIIAVPTPVNKKNKPDFKLLINASKLVGKVLKKNDVVIYESTVYPGATEEVCVPTLEKESSLKFNTDFFVGYSPERINPGDKKHTIKNIVKIVAGSNPRTANFVSALYSKIVKAGTYKVSSIKTAEAAKVIENTQRDLNIALINELSIIFKKLNLDTEEVLKAAETKWNFNSFRPGLVGGHCIGVDPYYLTYKSKIAGYEPEIILAGRKLNDHMSTYVTNNILEILSKKKLKMKKVKILVMGLSFKENCPDIRNSKILDVCKLLLKNKIHIEAYDPLIDKKAIELNFLNIVEYPKKNAYDCVIISAKHSSFLKMKSKKVHSFCNKDGFIYDLKYMLNKKEEKNYFRL
jgi:UDP-N-acetyl-D-galactosamine dehydrogenase